MKQKKNLSQSKEHYEMLTAKKIYENLMKPWYKKLEVWKFAAWSVLTLLSVTVLYFNGLFDFQTKALQAERNALLAQKEYLEYAKTKLSDEQVEMQLASNKMNEEKNKLNQEIAQLTYVKQMAFKSLDQRDKLFAQTIIRNRELEKQVVEHSEKIKIYESFRGVGSLFSTTSYSNNYDYTLSALSQYSNGLKYSSYPLSTSNFIDTNSLWKAIEYSEERKRLNPYVNTLSGSTSYLAIPTTTQYESLAIGKLGQSNTIATSTDIQKWWLKDVPTTITLSDKTLIPIKY